MNVIKPVTITDAMLLSSSVPETDYAAWNSGTTYAIGERAIKGHKIWESLQGSNTNHDPLTDTSDPPFWLEVSSTNRWRMFDETVNSQTTATSSIVVEVQPGAINAVGLIELSGASAKVELLDGSTVVYSQTQTIDNTILLDWYDYFFEAYDPASALVFENVPSYLGGTVRITIEGPGTVGCGGAVFGTSYDIGEAQRGAAAGVIDYSRKDTNPFGVTKVLERAYSKRATLSLMVATSRIRRQQALLASLRATPCLWVGVPEDAQTYAPLVIYGYWRDFQIEIAYPMKSLCSLELEGMI